MSALPNQKIVQANDIATEIKNIIDKPKQFVRGNKQVFLSEFLQKAPKLRRNIAVNINFPLCNFICGYCGFPVEKYTPRLFMKLIESLLGEIHQLGDLLGNFNIESLHFSGGTPSLLSGEDIEAIVGSLEMHTKLKGPITIEMNPEDVTDKKLTEYLDAGVDNIRIGVQTINDYTLEYLRRFTHLKNTVDMSLEIGKEYYPELVVELLYNFPDSSWEKINADIKYFLEQGVVQFSFYPLLVLPDTPFQRFIEKEKIQPVPSLVDEYKTYLMLDEILLSRGFEEFRLLHYVSKEQREIVYVPSFFESLFTTTIGIGPGAITSIENALVINSPDVKSYSAMVQEVLIYNGTITDQIWKNLFTALFFATNGQIKLPTYKDALSKGILVDLVKLLNSKKIIVLQDNQKYANFTAFGDNVFYFLYRLYIESMIIFMAKLKRNWADIRNVTF